MLGRVALLRIDVSEDLGASCIMVTQIGELGTTIGQGGAKFLRNVVSYKSHEA
jgi:hypothetical protein